MNGWRDHILAEFADHTCRLTLAADPDDLLLDEGVLEAIRARGFELITFEDPVAFRREYESRFRRRWDAGEADGPSAVVRFRSGNLGEAPYDLLQAGRIVSFDLHVIFPDHGSKAAIASARARRRLAKLWNAVNASIPSDTAGHGDWFDFAQRWAELRVLADVEAVEGKEDQSDIRALQSKINEAFTSLLAARYAGLINLPPIPPVMLHHIPRFLAGLVGRDPVLRVALVVVDGLALDQWAVMREAMRAKAPHLRFEEHAVFAWIPTLTSVSRQALFAGKPPFFFPGSIFVTDKEPVLWRRFWEDQGPRGMSPALYAKGLDHGRLDALREELSRPGLRVAGLVIDKVDKIMHGMEMGAAGMRNQVLQWVNEGFLVMLIDLLHEFGFSVFLTSDHGSIEAHGCGRHSEGAVAELRGARVRVYSDSGLRRKVHEAFSQSWEWEPVGLPADFLALLSAGDTAFVGEGERTVSHGGASLEEVIVPFVRIQSGDK